MAGGAALHPVPHPLYPRMLSARVFVLAGAIAALAAVTTVVLWRSPSPTSQLQAGGAPPPSDYFNLRGEMPKAAPSTRFALGFLDLDDPLDDAIRVFGPPGMSQPDLGGTTYTWTLGGGARLDVTAADEAGHPIIGLMAQLPSISGARVSVYGGAAVGSSPLRDVLTVWGRDYQASAQPGDDFAAMYALCRGGWPVVVKFDEDSRHDRLGIDQQVLGAPVTSVLIAYADEDPVASGCVTGAGRWR